MERRGTEIRVLTSAAIAAAFVTLIAAPATAQQVTGALGSPSATTTIDGKQLPPPPPKFGGVIKESRDGLDALVAAARRAAEGRAQRPADHDRRRGLRRLRHLRRRHPDAGARPHREGRAALHAVPLHRALLADARRADHRPQPPLGRLRRHRRTGHRLSRATTRSSARTTRPIGTILRRQRLRHVVVRQEPQHAGLPVQRRGPVRPVAVGHGLRVLLRLHGRRDRPVEALPVPRPHADLSVDRQARLQPDHRHGRRRDRLHATAERGGARQAVLRLLRAGRHARAAPADEGMDREVQGQVRHGLERPARADLRQPEAARRDPGERAADAVAGRPAEVGHASRRREEAVRPPGRGLRRLRRLYRPRDRPRHPGGRGHGQARQHADHLHRRRQRHQRRGLDARHANELAAYQRRHRRAGRGPAEVLRRLGLGRDLPAHGGGLVVGLRHAVQVDQADRLALRRHAPGHGDVLAGAHQGRGRHPQPVPPRHRHRADDPRGDRHPGARRRSTASRRSRSRA